MKLLNNLLPNRLFIGLIETAQNEWQAAIIEFRKQSLHLLESQTWANDDEMQKKLEDYPNIPIVLAMRQNQVIESWLKTDTQDVVSGVMGVQVEEQAAFCWQYLRQENEHLWVAIARRTQVLAYRQRLGKHQNRIVQLHLGAGSLHHLHQTTHSIKAHNKQLTHHPQQDTPSISLAALSQQHELPEAVALPFTAVAHYLQNRGTDVCQLAEIQTQRKQFTRLSQLRFGIFLGCFFSMILLFGNGLWAIWMKGELQFLEEKLRDTQEIQRQLSANAQQLTGYAQWQEQHPLAASYLSSKLDRVALSWPTHIALEALHYRPTPKTRKSLQLDANSPTPDLLLIGKTKSSPDISQLLSSYQTHETIKQARLQQTQFEPQQQQFSFILQLELP